MGSDSSAVFKLYKLAVEPSKSASPGSVDAPSNAYLRLSAGFQNLVTPAPLGPVKNLPVIPGEACLSPDQMSLVIHMNEVGKHFADAFRHLGGNRGVPGIEVRFYPYAGLRHTIRLRSGRVYVRLSDICKDSPPDVLRALAWILVSRLLGKRVPTIHDRVYREYSLTPAVMRSSDLARRGRGRKMISSAQGEVYDLDRMFAKLNRRYFDGQISKPTITWSQRRTRSILGHHDHVYDSITVSKTLDSTEVPEWFVEYILYHEMLHIKHPARLINGRRYYHTSAFRLDERRFPHYQEAQKWLERLARQRRVPRARAA